MSRDSVCLCRFPFFSQYISLSGSSGRTGEPGEDVEDIDTGLMICNATNISSWVSLTVSGQPSEGQLINYWIRAPPLGGGGHVTYRLTVHTGLSFGAEFFFRLS